MTFNWKEWFDTQENINHIISRLTSIHLGEQLQPHIYYICGPPSTGKKTFINVLNKIFNNTGIKYIIDSDIIIESHIHTYFVINMIRLPPQNIPYTNIFFRKQFTNTNRNFNKLHIESSAWIESITDTLRSDLNIPILNIPCSGPISRQSSCGSCDSFCTFVHSLPSPSLYIK